VKNMITGAAQMDGEFCQVGSRRSDAAKRANTFFLLVRFGVPSIVVFGRTKWTWLMIQNFSDPG